MPQHELPKPDPEAAHGPVFKVLGPLEVWDGDRRVNPGGVRQRHVLATLLIHADRVVPVNRLIRAVWDEEAPYTAGNQVRKMIWNLRRRLPDSVRILTEPPGYRLVLSEGQLDARTFETLLVRAGTDVTEGRADEAVEHLSHALDLWRGRALSGLSGAVVGSGGRDLDERRLIATERLVDLRLLRGEARALVPDLYSLVSAHPLHEGLRERLMLALYRIGRRADALTVMAQGRAELVELGIEPGTGLCRLQERILRDDPSLTLPEPEPREPQQEREREEEPQAASEPEPVLGSAPEPVFGSGPQPRFQPQTRSPRRFRSPSGDGAGSEPALVPAPGTAGDVPPAGGTTSVRSAGRGQDHGSLPYDLKDFTGRRRELDALLALGAAVTDRAPTIVTLTGMPGVGKTALAVHAAHRLAAAFPDGRLHLDLQGLTPHSGPPTLAEALRHLLLTLGTPAADVPDDLDGRLIAWRRAVAGRRVLMILDGVMDTATVRPLLPGTGGCLVVVTSRTVIGNLDGAVPIHLGPLSEEEAVGLLGSIIGTHRIADTAEARDLAAVCGRLPLALRIMGTRLNSRRAWSLAQAVGRLRRHDLRLRELTLADRSVATGIGQCYRGLSPAQQRMLLALRAAPTGSIDERTAARLAGVSAAEAEDALEGLVDACLLQSLPQPGGYALPELVRSFAVQESARPRPGAAPAQAQLPPRPGPRPAESRSTSSGNRPRSDGARRRGAARRSAA
ncbi:BTAD domain-containing putative transcriptional regulator [Streptomyces sp. NPDC090106]|uniref:AfsR/SARP family transcriptional regulator n=1 Tax=Streptomyces sp. NPDC090106 TaxID=3365946 RepID=UPI0038065F14